MRISVAIQPPAYTGLKESNAVDPEQLQAIEGSTFVLSIESSSDVSLDYDGVARALTRGPDGTFSGRLHVSKTGYVLATTSSGLRRMMPIVVAPDALPAVTLTAPGRDLVYAGGNARIVPITSPLLT